MSKYVIKNTHTYEILLVVNSKKEYKQILAKFHSDGELYWSAGSIFQLYSRDEHE